MHQPTRRAVRPAARASALLGVLAALLAVLLPLSVAGPAVAAVAAPPTVVLTTVPGGTAGVGEPVTLVATVTPATTTGTVTFSDGLTVLASNVPVVDGRASLVVPSLAAGPHSLDALLRTPTALADSGWVPFQVQTTATPWVSLTASSLSVFGGQPVTLTAQVSPGRTGWVSFFDNNHQLGSLPLVDGKATLALSSLAAGAHALVASYACVTCSDIGASAPLPVTVTQVLVTTMLSTPGPVTYSAPVTVTARVVPAATTGRLVFLDGDTPIGSVTERDGTASFTTVLHSGSHQMSARWESDQSVAKVRSAPVPLTVQPLTPSVTFTMTDVPTPAGRDPAFRYVEIRALLNPPDAIGIMKTEWSYRPPCGREDCYLSRWSMTAIKPAGSYVYLDYNYVRSVSIYRVCFDSRSPDYASVCTQKQVYTAPS